MVHICGRTTGVRALIPPIVGGPPLLPPPPQVEESKMTARAVLQCRPNSHPFPWCGGEDAEVVMVTPFIVEFL
ncbi:hypothetical protein Pcinc_012647 [Petrolisthes cinctipes]|uniref:Uncharacterized protein n=1 Tax=Petrolisthes cinctipes TaxID=88211 RepID=A0AAE1G0J2_PETCI|nr:hypothetical protein Pcinc_012647 [Petrolisthes cinctipes]